MPGASSRGHFFSLFAALLLFVAFYPYFQTGALRVAFMLLAALAIPLAGVYVASERRLHLIIALALGIPAMVASVEVLAGVNVLPGSLVALIFMLLFYTFTVYHIVTHVFATEDVTRDTLFAAASVYLLFGLTWSLAYALLERLQPGSFYVSPEHLVGGALQVTDFLYYSFVTLTTLGYGEIAPVTERARSASILESVTGVLYLAFLIARLVGVHARTSKRG